MGRTFLALVCALERLSPGAGGRRALLGDQALGFLATVVPDGWYPVEVLLSLLETLHRKGGHYSLLKVGRVLFEVSHGPKILEAKSTASQFLHGLDALYHSSNRGEGIGGWRVLAFAPDHALVQKTTPHHCALEEGLLLGGLAALGVHCLVTHVECCRTGGDACTFHIEPLHEGGSWR